MLLKSMCLVGLTLCSALSAAEELPIDRWDRAICLIEERSDPAGNKSFEAGAGFIVAASDSLVLVTATHTARFTTGKTRLIFRMPSGKSHWVALSAVRSGPGDPWHYHGQADIAAMQLVDGDIDPEAFESLSALAISAAEVLTTVPQRATAIEIVGFPMLLGVRPEVSPLVMKGHIASKQTPLDASWGPEQIVFTFPYVGHGCSGGLVYLSDENSAQATVVGMCIGFYQDKAGFKLSKVVPGSLIAEIVGRCEAASRRAIASGG